LALSYFINMTHPKHFLNGWFTPNMYEDVNISKDIPEKEGVYILFSVDLFPLTFKMVYIGRSNNLKKRLKHHEVFNMIENHVDIWFKESCESKTLEKELMGFSLSARPISEVIEKFLPLISHRIDEILNLEESGKNVKLAGVIIESRTILTKRNQSEMAFARLDDGTGAIEVVVFPKIFGLTRNFWTEGQPVLINGKVDLRDDRASVIVDSVQSFQDGVYIDIPKGTNKDQMVKLRNLLLKTPGKETTYLISGEKKLELPFKVTWNEKVAKEISEILGNGI